MPWNTIRSQITVTHEPELQLQDFSPLVAQDGVLEEPGERHPLDVGGVPVLLQQLHGERHLHAAGSTLAAAKGWAYLIILWVIAANVLAFSVFRSTA